MPTDKRPKLGQHFLADPVYRRRIVEALNLHSDDLVVEVGAGPGGMTELLAERARELVAIELDSGLAAKLREKFAALGHVEILEGDILHTDLRAVCRRHHARCCFVFGNLPYYITSPIIHHLFESAACIRGMGLLMQQEVAERLVAQPGRRDYGYLSVLVQVYTRPRIALRVPAGAFAPPPKVRSSLVLFEMAEALPLKRTEIAGFLEFVKKSFAQKRKTLVNNLANTYTRPRVEAALAALDLAAGLRAEQLSVEQLIEVFRRITIRQRAGRM